MILLRAYNFSVWLEFRDTMISMYYVSVWCEHREPYNFSALCEFRDSIISVYDVNLAIL